MITKTCFKCNKEKSIDDFYKHSRMKDGHLNKCKSCTKIDVSALYYNNIENIEYVERERKRGRDKYSRLNYKNRIKGVHDEGKNTRKKLKINGFLIDESEEVHHWNYNMKDDIFILGRRSHKLIHKYLKYDSASKMFLYNNELIDSKLEHFYVIREILNNNNRYVNCE